MSVNELLEDNNSYYIVTELLEGGELFDRIKKMTNFTPPTYAEKPTTYRNL